MKVKITPPKCSKCGKFVDLKSNEVYFTDVCSQFEIQEVEFYHKNCNKKIL